MFIVCVLYRHERTKKKSFSELCLGSAAAWQFPEGQRSSGPFYLVGSGFVACATNNTKGGEEGCGPGEEALPPLATVFLIPVFLCGCGCVTVCVWGEGFNLQMRNLRPESRGDVLSTLSIPGDLYMEVAQTPLLSLRKQSVRAQGGPGMEGMCMC